jgi:hypothetical protein
MNPWLCLDTKNCEIYHIVIMPDQQASRSLPNDKNLLNLLRLHPGILNPYDKEKCNFGKVLRTFSKCLFSLMNRWRSSSCTTQNVFLTHLGLFQEVVDFWGQFSIDTKFTIYVPLTHWCFKPNWKNNIKMVDVKNKSKFSFFYRTTPDADQEQQITCVYTHNLKTIFVLDFT